MSVILYVDGFKSHTCAASTLHAPNLIREHILHVSSRIARLCTLCAHTYVHILMYIFSLCTLSDLQIRQLLLNAIPRKHDNLQPTKQNFNIISSNNSYHVVLPMRLFMTVRSSV